MAPAPATPKSTVPGCAKGARKVVFPGLGHMSNMEEPELLNETVTNFLGSL